jgi:capsular polysaccharide biosynthesis protein
MIEIKRKLPENFLEEHLPYFKTHLEIQLPNPGHKYFPKRVLLFSNGMLLKSWRIEKQSLLYDTRLKEIGGHLLIAKKIVKAVFQNSIGFLKVKNDFTTITNEWSNNYFHWFTEAVPRLIYLLDLPKKPTVLLPINYKSAYQFRTLELLGFPFQTFNSQLIIAKKIFLPFRLAPYSAHYNTTIMKSLSGKLKGSVNLNYNKGNRIYISRNNAQNRKVINEKEVIETLKKFEFQILEFKEFTLDEQISMMHHTKILVSIHGAALTNMIFCEPGSKILELSLKNQVMDKCYFNLANCMNLKYYYQFCESPDMDISYSEANIFVDLKDLEKNLSLMVVNS